MGACPACGEPRSGDSQFCAACGTRLAPVAPEAPAPEPSAPTPTFASTYPQSFGPPTTPPTDPPPVVHTSSTGPSRNVLVAVGALVVALAAGAFVVLGSGDDGSAGPAAVTTTLPPLSTSPQLTDEEYLVDVLATEQGSIPLADEAERSCFFRSMIAAMGGAAGLRDAGIRPEQLGETFGLRGEVVPAGAVDVFLATNATCGLDLTEVIFVRPVNIEIGEAAAACVGANIDRVRLNALIADFFLDPNRSDFSFIAPGDLVRQTEALVGGCI